MISFTNNKKRQGIEVFIFLSPLPAINPIGLREDSALKGKYPHSSHYVYHIILELKKKKTHFLEHESSGAIKCNRPAITFDRENFSQNLI